MPTNGGFSTNEHENPSFSRFELGDCLQVRELVCLLPQPRLELRAW
jgi:hypothetical protein